MKECDLAKERQAELLGDRYVMIDSERRPEIPKTRST